MKRVFAQAGAALLSAGLLLVVLARPARGQQPAEPQSTCRPEILAVDTIVDTLFAWLPDRLRGEAEELYRFRSAQERTALGMVDAVPMLGGRARVPPHGAEAPPGAGHVGDAEALVWFQLRNDGRLAGMKLERRSGWPELDIALQRAVLRADSLRSFEPLPGSLAGTPIDLWVAVGFQRVSSTANTPVARVVRTTPRYRGEVVAPRLLEYQRARYPMAGARAGVGDSVRLEFVVDTTGSVVPESVRLVRGAFREFVVEALRTLRGARFTPARIGRCLVPMRIQMPLNFLITG